MKNRGSPWSALLLLAIFIGGFFALSAIDKYRVREAQKLVERYQHSPNLYLTAQGNLPGVEPYETMAKLDLSGNTDISYEAYVDGNQVVFGGTLYIPQNPGCTFHSVGNLEKDSAQVVWDCDGALTTETFTQLKFENANTFVNYTIIPMQVRVLSP